MRTKDQQGRPMPTRLDKRNMVGLTLTPTALDLLKQLAVERGQSRSGVVEQLIRREGGKAFGAT